MMIFDAAREQLAFHCGTDARVDDPRWTNGFLSTLRPYAGLRRDVLQDVDRCVDAVAAHLQTAPLLDRQVVSSLWAIVQFGRLWATDPDGMLQRSQLMTVNDTNHLSSWLEDLSFRIAKLLDGKSPDNESDGDQPE